MGKLSCQIKSIGKRALALVLCVGMLLPAGCGGVAMPFGKNVSEYAIAVAEYPEMMKMPGEKEFNYYEKYQEWRDSRQKNKPQTGEYREGLQEFCEKTATEFLSGAGAENKVYSPINVYMALGMLAELTDGESRRQILELMNVENIEALREKITAIWNANYYDDGIATSILASSLWLNENIEFVPETMQMLAETYYASAYQGEMGSDGFNKALQEWLNEQTGGLLEEQAAGIEMDPLTVLALAATIYYKAAWNDEFHEANTKAEIFHAPSGDVTCDFMHQSHSQTLYVGEKFSAVSKSFDSSGSMYLILPDEGVSVEEVVSDPELMDLLFRTYENPWENQKTLKVNLSMPKFDVASDLDLTEGLKNLGVTDVFDESVSDFTPMTEKPGLYVSEAVHAARVKVDEEGCEAAAYTVMMVNATAMMPPEEEIDFVLDRPFVFVITTGVPLFIGVVNQP